jgi:hypothetical protein
MIIGVIIVIIIFGFLGWLFLAMIKKEKNNRLVAITLISTTIFSIVLVYGSYYASTSDDVIKIKLEYEKLVYDLRYYARDYENNIYISNNDNQLIFNCSRLSKAERIGSEFTELYKRSLDFNNKFFEENTIREKNIFLILWYGIRYSMPSDIKEIKIIL